MTETGARLTETDLWDIAAIMRGYLAVQLGPLAFARVSPFRDERFIRAAEEAMLAEERDRAEWIAGVKRRLGLVTIEDRGSVVTRGRQYPDGPLEPERRFWP